MYGYTIVIMQELLRVLHLAKRNKINTIPYDIAEKPSCRQVSPWNLYLWGRNGKVCGKQLVEDDEARVEDGSDNDAMLSPPFELSLLRRARRKLQIKHSHWETLLETFDSSPKREFRFLKIGNGFICSLHSFFP